MTAKFSISTMITRVVLHWVDTFEIDVCERDEGHLVPHGGGDCVESLDDM